MPLHPRENICQESHQGQTHASVFGEPVLKSRVQKPFSVITWDSELSIMPANVVTIGVQVAIPATKKVFPQLDGVFPIDNAVIEGTSPILKIFPAVTCLFPSIALPEGVTFVSIEIFGTSAWTTTGRLTARAPDGTGRLFFIKVCVRSLLLK